MKGKQPNGNTRSFSTRRWSGGQVKEIFVTPLTLGEANVLVKRWHRHHAPPQGALFAIAASVRGEDEPCGAVIVGRPVARMLQDGFTAEVVRLVTNGRKNACSLLYAAAWRAARAMGYRRLVTYILNTESGTSLTAAGWSLVGEAGGGSWSRDGRPRVDKHPTQGKLRFEVRTPLEAAK